MDWSKITKTQAQAFHKSFNTLLKETSEARVRGIAAVAAFGLAAPALISNDDRGYFQSSVITTPLIAAAFAAFPKVNNALKSELPKFSGQLKNSTELFNNKNYSIKDLKTLQENHRIGKLSTPTFNRAKNRIYGNRTPQVSTIDAQILQLEGGLKTALDPSGPHFLGRQRYLENMIHAQVMSGTISTEELDSYLQELRDTSKTTRFAPKIGMDGVDSFVKSQIVKRNEAFIKATNFHLQKMDKMFRNPANSGYDGTIRTSKDITFPGSVPKPGKFGEVGRVTEVHSKTNKMWEVLETQRPDLHRELLAKIKEGHLEKNQVGFVKRVNSPSNEIVGLLIHQGTDVLEIAVENKDGRILAGKNFDKLGVARRIFTDRESMPASVFGIRYSGMGTSLVQKELDRVNIIGGVDKLKEWSTGESITRATDLQANLISNVSVASEITGFGDDGLKGFSKQTPYEMQEFMAGPKLDNLGLAKINSEKMNGTFTTKEVSDLAPGSMASPTKQDPLFRILTKPTALTGIDGSPASVPTAIPRRLEAAYQGGELPLVNIIEAGVSSSQQAFFARLPESVKDLHKYELEAIAFLQERHSLNETQARNAWTSLSKKLSNPRTLKAARKLGSLGDGAFLGETGLYGMSTTYRGTHYIDEPVAGLENLVGSSVDNGFYFGANMGNAIEAKGDRTTVDGIRKMYDGSIALEFGEEYKFGQGSGVDSVSSGRGIISEGLNPRESFINGKTGNLVTRQSESETISGLLSSYNQLTDSGPIISKNAKLFSLHGTGGGKGNIAHTMEQMKGHVLKNLHEMGQTDILNKYAGPGYDPSIPHIYDSNPHLSGSRKLAQFEADMEKTQQLFEETGARIRRLAIANPSELNQMGRNFAAQSKLGLADFLSVSENSGIMGSWRHVRLHGPGQVTTTSKMMQLLDNAGLHSQATEIMDRARYTKGDPNITHAFALHVTGEQPITPVMTVEEALAGKPFEGDGRLNLNTPGGRVGTIFDKDHPIAKNNFMLERSDGERVPVLGSEAYGGKGNEYDGKFSPSKREKAVKAWMKGEISEEQYIAAHNDILYGKKSYTAKSGSVDPIGIGNFAAPRESANPFEIGISPQDVKGIHDDEIRKALFKGDPVTGTYYRYPQNNVNVVKYKVDKSLLPGQFGVPKHLQQHVMGDFDGDTGYANLNRPSSQAHADALAMLEEGSSQHQALQIAREMRPDDFNELDNVSAKPIFERLEKSIGEFKEEKNIAKGRLINRKIGESNSVNDLLLGHLSENNSVFSQAEREKLQQFFFRSTVQVPISAAKHAHEMEIPVTLESAKKYDQQVINSLNPGGSVEDFVGGLGKQHSIVSGAGLDEHTEGLLRRFHEGRSLDVGPLVRSQTRNMKFASDAEKVLVKDTVEAAKRFRFTGISQTAKEASTAANMGAEAIGIANDGIASASRVAKAFKNTGAGKVLAAGLGIAAIAGLMTTSTKSVRSSNHYRPEETGAGQDQIPGAGVTGSHSSHPPMSMANSPQPPNVSRAMVAPIHQNTNVEVSMASEDQSRATELSKMIAKSTGGGQTVVTNNYNNNKLTSLRNKQKLRERLDEEA
jgi:hypothetical protein